jgi:3alpha(or 20beta)-hydroxysteroid dehydrogenase
MRLKNKVAIITGGAQGMGAATARLFASEGATVVIGDRDEASGQTLVKELGGGARFQPLDVADPSSWQVLVQGILAKEGRIDVLVNNAGIVAFAAIVDQPKADFERVLAVNLVGPFLGIQAVAPTMIQQRSGSIINISSIEGTRALNGMAAYASSKWAVRGLSRAASLELGHQGVRVNTVLPGVINTRLGNPMGSPLDDVNKNFRFTTPLQRIGESDEVARATLFLASDDASYICGAELVVDGGMMAGSMVPGLPGGPDSTAAQ